MSFTAPYRQHHYMGEHANDGSALTFIQAGEWDSSKDGTGSPEAGMTYYNTTDNELQVYNGTTWESVSNNDHGGLAGLGDDDHSQYHNDTRGDTRYFQKSEALDSSAGAGDAGKPIKLDAAGHVDATMINDGDIDHANIANAGSNAHSVIDTHLGDDTKHRVINDSGTGATELWSASKLDTEFSALSSGYSRRKKIIDVVDSTVAPPTEVAGDRYILDFSGAPHANWDGAAQGDIVEFVGAAWVATSPTEGWVAYNDTTDFDVLYVDDGTPAWESRNVGSSDHGALTGLGDDDHTQYHNDTRGDARYRTQSELSSTTASSEGALLVGTDSKANLGASTTVEAALTDLNTKNPPKRFSGSGTPNSGAGTAGAIGDLYFDTSNGISYINATGAATGWYVQ